MSEEIGQKLSDKELKEVLGRMVDAFNEFHEQMRELEKRQQNVIEHIQKRIDGEKLEDLKKKLEQM
ncbi:MAG: hypothetical protein COW24_01690 [Candidatus Kerfeldbacteria bacterium CG15_BIG_FIL_POST_REV_8_21_14_020_45_12]|uniref:Uncharacterized protein n=1 Tax=Candidatus Kerfeldbacteria bacterium CG15_BIG_FIL_POST_REV_8_21_14_020_45_12 TaxID=2014247 RepID=A0A2M7H4K6_9BACT|nr:MAG: hypothetical protein COW24_01690 [Candidatus Kerfeldbacteria bacterium CG15_BIG_FIL_POST_REV_8_21_14_020_45_12]PJA92922.1 MAG: hypothetical protein CO132_05430 [Candidatus Kerfeldbacteria bacterium CG_4_9_14_3_um_filter_45_8]